MNDPTPPPDLLAWLSSRHFWDVMAGALGGIVRWITLQETRSAGVRSVIVGSICAAYLGPLVAPLLEPVIGKIAPDAGSDGFAGFIVGLGGISIASLLIDVIRARRLVLKEAARNDPDSVASSPPPAPPEPPRALGDPEA